MEAVVTYDLAKQFDGTAALSGVNLQVEQGQKFACVGGAGSGKTTLIRLLSGLLRPTSGECTVMGRSPFVEAERLHTSVGTVINSARMYESMTLSENLRFFAEINGVEENDAIERISFLLHRLDIWEARDSRPNEIPTGVLRRGMLARALVHRPQLLLIDETAESIDKETAESVESLVSHLVEQEGLAIFLATQNMEYAERLCDYFAMLKDGKIIAKGTLDALREGASVHCRAKLRMAEGDTPPVGYTLVDGFWQSEIASEQAMARLISQAVERGKTLYEARLEKPSLREIYTAYSQGNLRKAGDVDEQNDELDARWDDQSTAQEQTAEQPADEAEPSDFGPLDPEILKLLQAAEDGAETDRE